MIQGVVSVREEIIRGRTLIRLGLDRWKRLNGFFGFTRPGIPSGEGILIECDVACNNDGTGRRIPEAVTLGTRFIPYEDHNFGFRLQFINPRILVCVDVGFTAKNSKVRHVRDRTIPNGYRRLPLMPAERLPVIDVHGGLDS